MLYLKLCNRTHCSISTFRRDLITLENRKLVKRVYGGVHLNSPSNTEFSYSHREMENIEEKKIIADLARDYINQGMCIFFDSSSTCQYLCQLIQGMPNMVCVTNGLRNAFILNEDQSLRTRVYMLGGELKPGAASITSFTDTNSLTEQFVYDFSFFSCRGIDLDGVYEASLGQAKIKQQIMRRSKHSILLVDEHKFDSPHFYKIADFADSHSVITNTLPTEDYQKRIDDGITNFIWLNPKIRSQPNE
ncbi:DeoR/GlpR family DNA-binding transcription regulator [Enterococcus casseliflavus]|uniref:DeoR/GlpR family DNA-binding transcription regulator n=1 Tax=Enterococcus casseliflavus TaxID=37734 RepID=UPI002DBDB184|nr:DeoR/GlpR family DNA-binding transcription regulator [Enterococcus casseliflavus]